jgi:Fe2+ or Zn2+ uptake regulation protein
MHLRSRELPGGANNTLETVRFAGRQKQTSYRAHIERALRDAGLRISRQRVVLAELLDQSERRRVTAEALYSDALKARCEVSRATVSHTLRQLELAGMLKRVAVPGSKKAWFVVERPIIGREHARREIGRFEAT